MTTEPALASTLQIWRSYQLSIAARAAGAHLRQQYDLEARASLFLRGSAALLPGAVPGARVAPGAPKPRKVLLHYSVELPLGVHRCQTVQPFKV